MSDSAKPEQIYAGCIYEYLGAPTFTQCWYEDQPLVGLTKYIRSDVHQSQLDATSAEADTLRQTVTNFAAINAERNAELEATRRQRDELLQALRALTSHKDSKLSTDVEYIGIHQRAQRILAQYAETTP